MDTTGNGLLAQLEALAALQDEVTKAIMTHFDATGMPVELEVTYNKGEAGVRVMVRAIPSITQARRVYRKDVL